MNAKLYGSNACNLSIELESCLRNVALYLRAQELFRLGTTTKCDPHRLKILVAHFSRPSHDDHNQQQQPGGGTGQHGRSDFRPANSCAGLSELARGEIGQNFKRNFSAIFLSSEFDDGGPARAGDTARLPPADNGRCECERVSDLGCISEGHND